MKITYPIKSSSCHFEVLPNMQSKKEMIARKIKEQGTEDAFFIADLGEIVKKHLRWISMMPRVEPFYAVKCNNESGILQILASLGTGFDCASKAEIEQVLSLGVDPSRIVYANPCKMRSHIKYAREGNVSMMTFDNDEELRKVKDFFPDAHLVIRILPPASKAVCNLGCKYGVPPDEALTLLKKAKQLDLNVIGVSFHVGSGCLEAEAFQKAIMAARKVFDEAQLIGYTLNLLDIGGGFPGFDQPEINFDEVTCTINSSINKLFPEGSGVRIIAEPGRYFAASAYTLAANVIAKREVEPSLAEDKTRMMYYINDGVYGSFNCILYDHAEIEVDYLKDLTTEPTYSSSLWGPTCDGLDCILPQSQMPMLDVGDWVYFQNMGAYTLAAGSTFNGMPRPNVVYFIEDAQFELVKMFEQESVQMAWKNNDVPKVNAKKVKRFRISTFPS
eukprot:TRINITY_DN3415_c0_g1_i1.p1 TRINITY_DN3415_c0_g1~~TRINITY_DN3415_c0_g1_i1.p1  ORF type:complete len:445 (+),score=87.63 TRINITY_DN3415_c0_g1_i1:293-1627(+)